MENGKDMSSFSQKLTRMLNTSGVFKKELQGPAFHSDEREFRIKRDTKVCDNKSLLLNEEMLSHALEFRECDYDYNPTKLFKCIESKKYSEVYSMLGKEEDADFCESNIEVTTWVVRKVSGTIVWRMLPLHAAIARGAPITVIDALISVSKIPLFCQDDRDQLPLHIAYSRNDPQIIDLILHYNPDAVKVGDYKGRYPMECARKHEKQNKEFDKRDVKGRAKTSERGEMNVLGIVEYESQKSDELSMNGRTINIKSETLPDRTSTIDERVESLLTSMENSNLPTFVVENDNLKKDLGSLSSENNTISALKGEISSACGGTNSSENSECIQDLDKIVASVQMKSENMPMQEKEIALVKQDSSDLDLVEKLRNEEETLVMPGKKNLSLERKKKSSMPFLNGEVTTMRGENECNSALLEEINLYRMKEKEWNSEMVVLRNAFKILKQENDAIPELKETILTLRKEMDVTPVSMEKLKNIDKLINPEPCVDEMDISSTKNTFTDEAEKYESFLKQTETFLRHFSTQVEKLSSSIAQQETLLQLEKSAFSRAQQESTLQKFNETELPSLAEWRKMRTDFNIMQVTESINEELKNNSALMEERRIVPSFKQVQRKPYDAEKVDMEMKELVIFSNWGQKGFCSKQLRYKEHEVHNSNAKKEEESLSMNILHEEKTKDKGEFSNCQSNTHLQKIESASIKKNFDDYSNWMMAIRKSLSEE